VSAGLLSELGTGPTREIFFPHPLIHAAVYAGLTPAQRSFLHSRAAGLTAGDSALAHRLAAATVPDDALAAELEARAADALVTGDLRRAALRLGQAADASEQPQDRHRRLLAACEAALIAGDLTTVEANLGELENLAGPRRDALLAWVAFLNDHLLLAKTLLDRAWMDIEASKAEKPFLGATVALRQGFLALLRLSPDEAVAWAAKAGQYGVSDVTPLARTVEHMAMGHVGRGSEALADRAATGLGPGPRLARMSELTVRAILKLVTDDLDGADRSADGVLGQLGAGPQMGLATLAASTRAEIHYRRGDLEAAVIAAELGVVMAHDSGAAAALTTAHAIAVWPLAAQGSWDRAEAHLRAAQARAGESPAARLWVTAAAWAVSCARGDAEAMLEAARDFRAAGRIPELGFFPFGPLLAEPLIMLGRVDEALDDLVAFEESARELGRASALLTAARVRGLLESARNDHRAAAAAFSSGLDLARNLPFRLEAARLHAAWGAALLRSGERRAGRAQLAEAQAQLTGMGAQAYAALAEPPAPGDPGGRARDDRDVLTRGETAVVGLVMLGLSNAQVAERLVVSRKAVEYHLSNVYAKLGISSRTQLVLKLGTPGLPAAADPGELPSGEPGWAKVP
jgi:ATP/maltotriose-dependent transcriptional regulator MalT